MKKFMLVLAVFLAIAVGANAATISWVLSSGSPDGFVFTYWKVSDPGTVYREPVTDGSAREVTIDPNVFEPGVDYLFEGWAYSIVAGEGPHLVSDPWNDGRDTYDPGEPVRPPAIIYLKPAGIDQIIIEMP